VIDEFKPVVMKRISPELEAEIVRRYIEKGQSINIIRFATDVSPNRIREVLVKNGVQIKKPGPGKGYVHYGRRRRVVHQQAA
jgi:transposase-like protein